MACEWHVMPTTKDSPSPTSESQIYGSLSAQTSNSFPQALESLALIAVQRQICFKISSMALISLFVRDAMMRLNVVVQHVWTQPLGSNCRHPP